MAVTDAALRDVLGRGPRGRERPERISAGTAECFVAIGFDEHRMAATSYFVAKSRTCAGIAVTRTRMP